MRLDHAWIERHIPHHGRMCLLDEVLAWSAERISCRSGTHHAVDHPLRAHGRLGIVCGIEYAAQAMAIHGALLGGAAGGSPAGPGGAPAATANSGATTTFVGAPEGKSAAVFLAGALIPTTNEGTPIRFAGAPDGKPAAGFLAGVRGVRLHRLRLDDVQGDLICAARRIAGDQGTALYEFELRCAAGRLIDGRATVVHGTRERLKL